MSIFQVTEVPGHPDWIAVKMDDQLRTVTEDDAVQFSVDLAALLEKRALSKARREADYSAIEQAA